MKDICQALFEYLSSREEIVSQVGTRIYPILLPQDAPLPSIVYAPVLCNYDSALQGDTGYVRQTIQIICHARTFKLARELSRDIKRSLQDFHGDMCGLHIQAVFIKSDYEYDANTSLKFSIALSNNANVRISMVESGVNCCTATITNKSSTAQTATITVEGNAIELTSHTLTVRDEQSIKSYGAVEYSHTASELVQSEAQAERIGNLLLRRMRAGEGVITTEWRGDPALEIGTGYDCVDRFGDGKELVCEYNKFSYDGGLKQQTRGRSK